MTTIEECINGCYFQLLEATRDTINCIQQNTYSAELFLYLDTKFGPISLTGMLMRTNVLFPKRIFSRNIGKSQSK